jgi:hypothetical protein
VVFRTVRQRWAQQRRCQRGAAAAEFAVILLPLVTMIFAIIEGGFMMRNYASLGATVQESVRVGSISGPELNADYRILTAVEDNLVVSRSELKRVVVFHADSPNDEPTLACKQGIASSVVGQECNVYTVDDLALPETAFGCKVPGALDSFWCPTVREDGGISFADTDLIGVYLEVDHEFVTGFFGQKLDLSRMSILPLERGA